VFFYFKNDQLAASIAANKAQILSYEQSIEKIQSNKKIIAAELVANNKPGILMAIKASAVQNYINELQDISKKYKLMFSGFSYEYGKISTSATASPERITA
jgi:hypothetical protein